MKKKFKRFGKSSISLLLSLLMIVSCMAVGSPGSIEAKAATYTLTEDRVYFIKDFTPSTWNSTWFNNAKVFSHIWCEWDNGNSSHNVTDIEAKKVTNTDDIYFVKVNYDQNNSGQHPNMYNKVIFTRQDPSATTIDWNYSNGNPSGTLYNKTGNIDLYDGNQVTGFSENGTSATFSTYKPTVPADAITFTASSGKANVDEAITLNAATIGASAEYSDFDFSQIVNKISDSYTVSKNGSAAAEGTDYTLTGNNITFKTAGTYTVTDTVSYYPWGYNDNATQNSTDKSVEIVVSQPTYTGITVVSQGGVTNAAKFTNGETAPEVTGSISVTANKTAENGGQTYYFTNWSSEQGTFADAYALVTNFTPTANGATAYANYTNQTNEVTDYTKTSGENDVGNVKVSSSAGDNKVVPGGKATLTYTPNGDTTISSIIVNYTDTSGSNKTLTKTVSGTSYEFEMPELQVGSNVTVNYVTETVSTYQITAYIDDSNRVTNRITFDQAYHASISCPTTGFVDDAAKYTGTKSINGDNTVITSTTNGMIYMTVKEGTQVTLTLYDENYDSTPPDDFIIDKWSLSSGNGSTATTRNLGEFSMTITPTENIDATGFFKEDEGEVITGNDARYLMFTKEDGWDNWGNGNAASYMFFVPVKKTVSGTYLATLGESQFGSELQQIQYYFLLSSSDNYTGLYTHNSAPTIISLNEAYITRDSQYKSSHGFGRLTCVKGGVTGINVYFSNLNADASYTLDPVVSDTNDPSGTDVTIIAKDGTIRGTYRKYADMADTKILSAGTNERTGDNKLAGNPINMGAYNNRAETVNVASGSTITFQTEIESDYRNTYEVKAFNINGETYFPEDKGDGVYECSYDIPADVKRVEITPIYYYKETAGTVTFYVEGFEGDVKTQWGNGNSSKAILSAYAWYNTDQSYDVLDENDSNKPALGGYPGQPMIYVNGRYEMQVPKYVNGNSVLGVTLNNYVWDEVHSQTLGANSDTERENINCQTYDYDDFVELAKITNDIIFRFKYRTAENKNDGSRYEGNKPGNSINDTTGWANGFEVYTDYYGNVIDLRNYRHTTNSDETNWNVIYDTVNEVKAADHYTIVSDGYQDMYLGHFAVMWNIYKVEANSTSGTLIAQLPSSALFYDPKADSNVTFNNNAITNESAPASFISALDRTTRRGNWSGLDSRSINDYWTAFRTIYNANVTNPLPAIITYETAIKAQDVNGNGHPKDPALRNDGRWYYSKANDPVPSWEEGEDYNVTTANIIIEYSAANSTDFIEDSYVDSNGTTLTDAGRLNNTDYVGQVTGAKPIFTKITENGNSVVSGVSIDNLVMIDSTKDLEFSAPAASTGVVSTESKTPQNYEFVGWFIKYTDETSGNVIYSPVNQTDLTKNTGKLSQIGAVTLVARYKPTTEQYLTVSHDLYKNAPKHANMPEAGTGTGTTGITVSVFDNSDNVVYSFTTSNISATGSANELKKYKGNGYTLKIELTAAPDDGNTFADQYLMYANSGDNGGYQTYYSNSLAAGPNGISGWSNDKSSTAPGSLTKSEGTYTITWSIPVSSLFNGDELRSESIDFFTDLHTDIDGKIPIVFKYYDRNDSTTAHGQPEDIDSVPTEITVYRDLSNVTTLEGLTYKIAGAFTMSGTDTNNGTKTMPVSQISSMIDEYYFWPSNATAVESFGKLKNLHSANAAQTYGDSYTNKYLKYHANRYGYLPSDGNKYEIANGDNSANETWVTYYKGENPFDAEASGADLSGITKIVVWGFNTPKDYTISYSYPSKDDFVAVGIDTTNNNSKYKLNDNVYYRFSSLDQENMNAPGTYNEYLSESNETSGSFKGKYNERIGEEFIGSSNDGVNALSTYFQNVYGTTGDGANAGNGAVTSGKLPGSATIGKTIEAPEEILVGMQTPFGGDSRTTYVFDGWYAKDGDSYYKVCSDAHYNNRIAGDLTIVAGYILKPGDDNTDPRGISLSENVEKFIDETNTSYARYQTVVNAYGFSEGTTLGSKGDDRNNIEYAAVAYLLIPKKYTQTYGSNGNSREGIVTVTEKAILSAFQTKFNNNNVSDIFTGTMAPNGNHYPVNVDATVTYDDENPTPQSITCAMTVYIYQVQPTDDSEVSYEKISPSQIRLTNKNRAQISLILPANAMDQNDIQEIASYVTYQYQADDSTIKYYYSDNALVFTETE